MKISRTVAYAIGATVQLASVPPEQLLSCNVLANRTASPHRFLLQILRLLTTHGILTSIRGTDGGYRLARAPDQISILQIIEAFDHSFSPQIPEIPGISPQARNRLLATVQEASSRVRSELAKVTLADLLEAQSIDRT